jgi:hypothetical protein
MPPEEPHHHPAHRLELDAQGVAALDLAVVHRRGFPDAGAATPPPW